MNEEKYCAKCHYFSRLKDNTPYCRKFEVKMSEEIINNVDECDDWTEPFVEEEVPEQWRK
jgi:hypothetical protein